MSAAQISYSFKNELTNEHLLISSCIYSHVPLRSHPPTLTRATAWVVTAGSAAEHRCRGSRGGNVALAGREGSWATTSLCRAAAVSCTAGGCWCWRGPQRFTTPPLHPMLPQGADPRVPKGCTAALAKPSFGFCLEEGSSPSPSLILRGALRVRLSCPHGTCPAEELSFLCCLPWPGSFLGQHV